MIDFEELRARFNLRENRIWLNNCGISLPPKSSAEAVTQYLEAYSIDGAMQTVRPHGSVKQNIQNLFAKFLGGTPEEYAILNNTAEGMTFIADALPLKAGDKILLVEREYPSNVYPYLQLKKRGIQIEFVSPGESNDVFIENIRRALTPQVKAMSVSAVDWLTGRKFDLTRIGEALRSNRTFFILDAAQGAGHVDIDVKKLGVDAMAFSCWKWFLGPLGSGGLYVSHDFFGKLDIRVAGTSSVANDAAYLPYREDFKQNAERFMLSTAPYMNWVFLEASLQFLDAVGIENVKAHNFELAEAIASLLRSEGWTLLRDRFGEDKTAIVCAYKSGNMNEVHQHFTKEGVQCALREGSLRFSPHLNVGARDLERFAGIVNRAH